MQKRCRDVLEELFFGFKVDWECFLCLRITEEAVRYGFSSKQSTFVNSHEIPFPKHCILTRTRWHPLDSDPPEGKHRRVMVDVQERELIVLLAEDEEERVGELQHLREVIPPNGIDNLRP